jgi:hypothetical protein
MVVQHLHLTIQSQHQTSKQKMHKKRFQTLLQITVYEEVMTDDDRETFDGKFTHQQK